MGVIFYLAEWGSVKRFSLISSPAGMLCHFRQVFFLASALNAVEIKFSTLIKIALAIISSFDLYLQDALNYTPVTKLTDKATKVKILLLLHKNNLNNQADATALD